MSTRRSRATRVHYGASGPRCGARTWTAVTGTEADVTCQRCQDLIAGAYHAGWRMNPLDLKPCGTLAAARRHHRRGERVCESCRQACNRAEADRRKQRTRKRKGLAA